MKIQTGLSDWFKNGLKNWSNDNAFKNNRIKNAPMFIREYANEILNLGPEDYWSSHTYTWTDQFESDPQYYGVEGKTVVERPIRVHQSNTTTHMLGQWIDKHHYKLIQILEVTRAD